jgi:hypothetical protein
MALPEVTEEYTDSVELVEQPVEQAQPTIYDQAYWDQDRERLAALGEQFAGRRPQDLEPAQKDRLLGVLWKEHWVDHQINKQLALRIGELSVQLSGLLEAKTEAPKPRQRRARVPKAALPTLGSAEVIANEV